MSSKLEGIPSIYSGVHLHKRRENIRMQCRAGSLLVNAEGRPGGRAAWRPGGRAAGRARLDDDGAAGRRPPTFSLPPP